MRAMSKKLLGVLCCFFAATVWAAEVPVAGTASTVVGQVSAVNSSGLVRSLNKDYVVYSGERVLTGPTGYVRLSFLDGGTTVLRPNSEFEIVSFRFQTGPSDVAVKPAQPKPVASTVVAGLPALPALPALQVSQQTTSGNQAFFRLIRGGFRSVSGLVGKISREQYSVRTPVATIGIRGTVFLSVTCDAQCAADAGIQSALSPGEVALDGAVSGVDEGSIVVTSTANETQTVNANEFILTTAAGHHIALPARPGFLTPEHWLESSLISGAVLPSPSSPPASALSAPSQKLLSSSLSTTPVVGAGAAVLLGAVVLVTGSEDGDSGTSSTSTSTTSTQNP